MAVLTVIKCLAAITIGNSGTASLSSAVEPATPAGKHAAPE